MARCNGLERAAWIVEEALLKRRRVTREDILAPPAGL
jgi:hypothetical protein